MWLHNIDNSIILLWQQYQNLKSLKSSTHKSESTVERDSQLPHWLSRQGPMMTLQSSLPTLFSPSLTPHFRSSPIPLIPKPHYSMLRFVQHSLPPLLLYLDASLFWVSILCVYIVFWSWSSETIHVDFRIRGNQLSFFWCYVDCVSEQRRAIC